MRMRRGVLIVAIALLVPLTAATWAAVALNATGPSPAELAADIAEIDAEIAEAKASAARYQPQSLVAAEIQTRLAFLATTRAMLDQKRRSWLRGIELVYTVDGGPPVGPIDPATLARLVSDRDAALKQAEAAHAKAAPYAGGLILAIILLEEETHRATVAMVNQQIAAARLGLTIPRIDLADMGAPATPMGQTKDDPGAL